MHFHCLRSFVSSVSCYYSFASNIFFFSRQVKFRVDLETVPSWDSLISKWSCSGLVQFPSEFGIWPFKRIQKYSRQNSSTFMQRSIFMACVPSSLRCLITMPCLLVVVIYIYIYQGRKEWKHYFPWSVLLFCLEYLFILLIGQIPSSFGNCTKLEQLHFQVKLFRHGTIPEWFGILPVKRIQKYSRQNSSTGHAKKHVHGLRSFFPSVSCYYALLSDIYIFVYIYIYIFIYNKEGRNENTSFHDPYCYFASNISLFSW